MIEAVAMVLVKHMISKTVRTSRSVALVFCECGEKYSTNGSVPIAQAMHISEELSKAVFEEQDSVKADILREVAKDARARGDVGKEGGVSVEGFLEGWAVRIENS